MGESEMTMKVGFVGLGLMGQAMSHNLVKDGYEVFGYDILPDQIKTAEEKGVIGLNSPREVAQEAELVISAVPNAMVVE
jgi:3-hydroxyisobutyrate dehydrogenase-like beta-hydroxyacid dehydrogenase